MRRLLGTVPALALAGLLLAGCGDETPAATDPAPTSPAPTSPTSSPATSPATTDEVSFELVEMVSVTAGRGTASEQAVELASPDDVDAFVAAFSGQLADGVQEAYAAHPLQDGQRLWAAVVGLGCDVPPGVTVTAADDGYAIRGTKVVDPRPECFAPVTSVALVAVDG